MGMRVEELDGEFRLLVQQINSILENSFKTNHEKKRLKLWLDKLLLENENDEKTKSNRNEYARFLADYVCKKGALPGICYREPPEGKLPPLRQLMKGADGTDECTSQIRREEKLKNFTQEAGCHGRAAYDEAFEAMRKHKQQLDSCIRGQLQQLITEERDAADDELQFYNSETKQLRDSFRESEKEIMEVLPHFKWSEYQENPDSYLKEILQQCAPQLKTDNSDCQTKRMEELVNKAKVENQLLESRLDQIRCEVTTEVNELTKIINNNECHLESVNQLRMRIDHVDGMINAIMNELDECSGGEY